MPNFDIPQEPFDDGAKVDNLIHQITQLPKSTQIRSGAHECFLIGFVFKIKMLGT